MATKPNDDDIQWEVEDADTPVSDIEIEDDTPEEDRGREPMPKEVVDELGSKPRSLPERKSVGSEVQNSVANAKK